MANTDPTPPNEEMIERSPGDRMMETLYSEFRRLAKHYLDHESTGHTLQPTALVNEAYVKLANQLQGEWSGRTHFFAIGARAMRQILVDHARQKGRLKRGGGRERVDLSQVLTLSRNQDPDLLDVDEAIDELTRLNPRHGQIVELRFFGGLTVPEVAEALGVSRRTIEADWTMLKAWLRRRLSDDE